MLSHGKISYDEFQPNQHLQDMVEASDVQDLTLELKGECFHYTLNLEGFSTYYSPEVGSSLVGCFVLVYYIEPGKMDQKVNFSFLFLFPFSFFFPSSQKIDKSNMKSICLEMSW